MSSIPCNKRSIVDDGGWGSLTAFLPRRTYFGDRLDSLTIDNPSRMRPEVVENVRSVQGRVFEFTITFWLSPRPFGTIITTNTSFAFPRENTEMGGIKSKYYSHRDFLRSHYPSNVVPGWTDTGFCRSSVRRWDVTAAQCVASSVVQLEGASLSLPPLTMNSSLEIDSPSPLTSSNSPPDNELRPLSAGITWGLGAKLRGMVEACVWTCPYASLS